METILSVVIGICLSAACGFRVFLPLFAVSLAGLTGYLSITEEFRWLASYPAVIALGVAMGMEIAAYYIPLVDNLLDAIAGPMAVVAGMLVAASVMTDLPPLVRWMLVIIAGGGAAATTQLATTHLRVASSLLTGGIANPIFSTIEAGISLVVSVLAILIPLLALVVWEW